MPDDFPGYVWVVDAMSETGLSREFFRKLVGEEKLHPWNFPGKRRMYFKREELAAVLAPQPGSPAKREDDTDNTGGGVNAQ